MERVSKETYYLNIALEVAKRSTCLRRCYGAVIVKNDEIISTGYNGSPRSCTNCIDIGYCYRKENNIPSGEQYEKCKSIHAEQNAIISASRKDMLDATLYLSGFEYTGKDEITKIKNMDCCTLCKRFIINAGISKVIFDDANGIRRLYTIEWHDNY